MQTEMGDWRDVKAVSYASGEKAVSEHDLSSLTLSPNVVLCSYIKT